METATSKLISYKAKIGDIHDHEVGGKAWNLFRLRNYGFPVPPWFVVSSQTFDEIVGPQRPEISEFIRHIDFSDQDSIAQASQRIRQIINHIDLPEQFCQDLSGELEHVFGKGVLTSVRSSAIGEDSTDNSFAGQMDSFLNVIPGKIIVALKGVWASVFSERALIYRHTKRLSCEDLSTAVIVQKMVQSVTSGVLFTRNQDTKEKECVISAGFGLGEGIVQDLVETDTYRIKWDSDEISAQVSTKENRITARANNQGGIQMESLSQALRTQSVLSNEQIRKLRDEGMRLDQCFGKPQDVEWAFDDSGTLFILQARPIVFTKNPIAGSNYRIWDNSNIVESYPGLTLPLTFSFIRAAYESTFRNATFGLTLSKNEIKKGQEIFKNMLGLLNGRVYYNLLNWYEMLSFLPDFKRHHKDAWDRMIGISQKTDCPQYRRSLFSSLITLVLVSCKLLSVRKTAQRFFHCFNSVYKDFKDADLTEASESDLIAMYNTLSRQLLDKWHLTAYNDFCATKYYDWLRKICCKWGLEDSPNLHNKLLCHQQAVESVAPVRSLVSIAERIRNQPHYRLLLSEKDNHTIWRKIQNDQRYATLKKDIENHLQAYGDRGLEELKLDKPTFQEEPERLIDLIRDYYRSGLSVKLMEAKEQRMRGNAEDFVRKTLRNPFRRLVFWFVLRNARLSIANRENMRFARSRIYGIVRRIFRRMADLFVANGLLATTSDIHYLTMDEVFGIVQGTAITQNLQTVVELRKSEYADFARRTPQDRIETTDIPYLNSFHGTKSSVELSNRLVGIGCCSGSVQGKAKVVFDPHSNDRNENSILIARSTDPGWVFLMVSSKGIVVEKGSVLSHTAIIGRELGIPTIVGAKNATDLIPDGANISMNGSTGEIQWQ